MTRAYAPYAEARFGTERAIHLGYGVLVASASEVNGWHMVTPDGTCTCQGFKFRGRCRHIEIALSLPLPPPLPAVADIPRITPIRQISFE